MSSPEASATTAGADMILFPAPTRTPKQEMDETTANALEPETIESAGNETEKKEILEEARPYKSEVEAKEDYKLSSEALEERIKGKDIKGQWLEGLRFTSEAMEHTMEKLRCARHVRPPPAAISEVVSADDSNVLREKEVPEPVEEWRRFVPRTQRNIIYDDDAALARGYDPRDNQPLHKKSKMATLWEIVTERLRNEVPEPLFHEDEDEDDIDGDDERSNSGCSHRNSMDVMSHRNENNEIRAVLNAVVAAKTPESTSTTAGVAIRLSNVPERQPSQARRRKLEPETEDAAAAAAAAASLNISNVETEESTAANTSGEAEHDTSSGSQSASVQKKKIRRLTEADRLMAMDFGPKEGGRLGKLPVLWSDKRRRGNASTPAPPTSQSRKLPYRKASERKKVVDDSADGELGSGEEEEEERAEETLGTSETSKTPKRGGKRKSTAVVEAEKQKVVRLTRSLSNSASVIDEIKEEPPSEKTGNSEEPPVLTPVDEPRPDSATDLKSASNDSSDSPRKFQAVMFAGGSQGASAGSTLPSSSTSAPPAKTQAKKTPSNSPEKLTQAAANQATEEIKPPVQLVPPQPSSVQQPTPSQPPTQPDATTAIKNSPNQQLLPIPRQPPHQSPHLLQIQTHSQQQQQHPQVLHQVPQPSHQQQQQQQQTSSQAHAQQNGHQHIPQERVIGQVIGQQGSVVNRRPQGPQQAPPQQAPPHQAPPHQAPQQQVPQQQVPPQPVPPQPVAQQQQALRQQVHPNVIPQQPQLSHINRMLPQPQRRTGQSRTRVPTYPQHMGMLMQQPALPQKPEVYPMGQGIPVVIAQNKTLDYTKWQPIDVANWAKSFLPGNAESSFDMLIKEEFDGSLLLEIAKDDSVRNAVPFPYGHWRKLRQYASAVVNEFNLQQYNQQMIEYNNQMRIWQQQAFQQQHQHR